MGRLSTDGLYLLWDDWADFLCFPDLVDAEDVRMILRKIESR